MSLGELHCQDQERQKDLEAIKRVEQIIATRSLDHHLSSVDKEVCVSLLRELSHFRKVIHR